MLQTFCYVATFLFIFLQVSISSASDKGVNHKLHNETRSTTTSTTTLAAPFEVTNLRGFWLDPDDQETNQYASLATAKDIGSSRAVWQISGLVPGQLCDELVESAYELALDYRQSSPSKKVQTSKLIRLPTQAAEARSHEQKKRKSNRPHWFAPPLPTWTNTMAEHLFRRILATLDQDFHGLVQSLFGEADIDEESNPPGHARRSKNTSLLDLFERDLLVYTSREPAINVYTKGGEFRPHTDSQALTVLVTLTEGDIIHEEGGGGTAYWALSQNHRRDQPALTLKPLQKGSLLLFGGDLVHSGLPLLTDGRRVILVASFSKKKEEPSLERKEEQAPPEGEL